jgi:hypothetical protein
VIFSIVACPGDKLEVVIYDHAHDARFEPEESFSLPALRRLIFQEAEERRNVREST